jgi:hypothetical protein
VRSSSSRVARCDFFSSIYDRRPDFIVRCANVADVRTAVNFARQEHLSVAVRGASCLLKATLGSDLRDGSFRVGAVPGTSCQDFGSGSFVPFTIMGGCSRDTPMQTKLWQLVRQTKQPLASILLATFCTGLSHPYHTNSTNTRYHVNLVKPSRARQHEDSSWYTPPRSPQFDDSTDS